MKNPWLAFVLNLLLPGAGFCYLKKWKWALLNFTVVLGVGLMAAFLLPEAMIDKWMQPLSAGLAMSSGFMAKQAALLMNKQEVGAPKCCQ